MRIRLLDTNVLVALLWPSHSQHGAAIRWFTRNSAGGWATCPFTQAGFVRVVSNPAFSRDAVTPAEAAAILGANLQSRHHRFWPDDTPFADAVAPFSDRLFGHRQVTDAYLLGLASRHRGTLATFDAGIADLPGPSRPGAIPLEVIRP